jgi:hypothetical protein
LASFASWRFKKLNLKRQDAKDAKNSVGGTRRVARTEIPSILVSSSLLNRHFSFSYRLSLYRSVGSLIQTSVEKREMLSISRLVE